jgi:hypothetical protein
MRQHILNLPIEFLPHAYSSGCMATTRLATTFPGRLPATTETALSHTQSHFGEECEAEMKSYVRVSGSRSESGTQLT